MQIVEVLAHSQDSAFAMHMTREAILNRSLGKGLREDIPGALAHLAIFCFAGRIRHAGDYK